MMRFLIGIPIVLALVIAGLSIYLSPDDLRHCKEGVTGQPPCQGVDAIVAVSGGDTTSRTSEAISLYQQGWAPLLIFSGAAQDKSGPSNAEVMRTQAIEAGVPEGAIITEEYSETTKQNAEKTQSLFDAQHIKSIVLVTSGYHQRRASMEFAKRSVGVKIVNHPASHDKDWSGWWWLTPRGWYLATSEFFKTMFVGAGGPRA